MATARGGFHSYSGILGAAPDAPLVPQQLELLSPFQLYFNPHLVFRKFQVWRLVTNFLFFGPLGFSFFFNMLFVYPAPKAPGGERGWGRRRPRAAGRGETETPQGGTSYTDAAGSATAACWRRALSVAAPPTSSSCLSSGVSL